MNALLKVSFLILVFTISMITSQDFTEEQRKQIIQNRQECIAETKVNPDLIEKADQGDFSEDDTLKCFTKCFYQKAGFVNENGEVQLEVIKDKLPAQADREKALEIVEKCKMEGKDPCDTVYLIHKCYFEHTHVKLENATDAAKETKS
nr:odorant-binding protein 2 [Euplatypus parallelus]